MLVLNEMFSTVDATLGDRSLTDYQDHICTYQSNAEAVGDTTTSQIQSQQLYLERQQPL